MQLITLIFAIMLAGNFVAGCTGSTNVNPANTIKTSSSGYNVTKLVVGYQGSISSYTVNIANNNFDGLMTMYTSPSMMRYGPDQSILPNLADSWDTTNLQDWTFHLVHNATWDDGVPVTAQDVKFTIDYVKEKKVAWGDVMYLNVVSVEAPDDYTVVVHLTQPDYNFLQNFMSNLIIPEHIWKNVDDPEKFTNESAIAMGSGPYKFAGIDEAAGTITFKANDNYWGGKPAIGEIVIKYISNYDALMLALQNGDIDVPIVSNQGASYYSMPKILSNDNLTYMMVPSFGIRYVIYFNNGMAPFDNASMRQALSYAINYDELNNLFTAGYGTVPNAGLVPGSCIGYAGTRQMAYDVNKSKAMLDDLGYKDVNGDGYREAPDGSRLQPEIVCLNDDNGLRIGPMLQKYFASVGIDLKLKYVDGSTVFDLAVDISKNGNYQMLLYKAPFWAFNDYEGYGSAVMDPESGEGFSNVTDPQYKILVNQLGTTLEKNERLEVIENVQEYYANELPAIPLYSMDYIQPYNKKYKGWVTNPTWGVLSYGTFFSLHEA
jgi:peptide/nickel transport system substrate-binding protein